LTWPASPRSASLDPWLSSCLARLLGGARPTTKIVNRSSRAGTR
jgi:hypothetical protein